MTMHTGEPADVVCHPIGTIRSRFKQAAGTPIQTIAAPDEIARLEVLPQFAAGLRDLEAFEFAILITHFHDCEHERLEVAPFLDDRTHGVFATRAPARPNRLGLSIVRLVRIDGATIHFSGNDMVDGTPVLDIKPYVPRFDARATERVGWFSGRLDELPGTVADDRMA